MVGTTIIPLPFSPTPPCCPCPVLATEIRCRAHGSIFQLSPASEEHLNNNLFSASPYTKLGTTFTLVRLNTSVSILSFGFIKLMSQTITSNACPCVELPIDSLSSFRFLGIPTIKAQVWPRNNLSICLLVPQSYLITPVYCQPLLMALLISKTLLPSSLPLFFSDWDNHPSGDFCPQFFSARLSGDALSFYGSLIRTGQTNMNLLPLLFWTRYAPNQDVHKAKVKGLRQQPGQTICAFFESYKF